jgi:hypothetical protein
LEGAWNTQEQRWEMQTIPPPEDVLTRKSKSMASAEKVLKVDFYLGSG